MADEVIAVDWKSIGVGAVPTFSTMKWKIVNKKKASELHLETLDCGLLIINLKSIPAGMYIEEYIKYIQEEGIVLVCD